MSLLEPVRGNAAAADMSRFYQIFFEETAEQLTAMESLLLGIDTSQPAAEAIDAIFRAAHSIKGGSGTFGFRDMAALTHEAESLLARVRKRELALNAPMIDALLEAGDVLRAQLSVHRGEPGMAVDAGPVVARLNALASGAGRPKDDACITGGTDAVASSAMPAPPPGQQEPPADFGFFSPEPAAQSADPGYGLFDDGPGPAASAAPPAWGRRSTDDPTIDAAPAGRRCGEKRVVSALGEASSIRVSVDKVDQLIDLVGELVISQAMLAQRCAALREAQREPLLDGLSALERNTRSLQDAVMSIRMLPMSFVFNRFPRMLRDLALKLGKQVELRTEGEQTELDKGVIEKISDPINHLVRNALDHGIELPAARVAAGKPARGVVSLRASQRGGSALIEVEDDGNGLDRARILAAAAERGLSPSAAMSDAEVWQLIFAPGFSTAETITDVSGRGVGMDVVDRNIRALGGSVEIDSTGGSGTRISVRLPLTLAIMDGMSVSVGGYAYVIPLACVVELLAPGSRAIRSVSGQGRVVEVRSEFLPVISLAEKLDPRGPRSPNGPPGESDGQIMVIVEVDGGRTALLVDELYGQHQVVVKSIETHYRRVAGVSGATIMGDGKVALILDIGSLVRQARH